MLSVLQNKSLDYLDQLVRTLESYETIQKRQSYLASNCLHSHWNDVQTEELDIINEKEDQDGDVVKDTKEEKDMDPSTRFKQLSFELIDIGIHSGFQGINYIKQTQGYSITDQYLHYDEKVDLAKEKGIQVFRFINERVYSPFKKNIYAIYDHSLNSITFMINVISDSYHGTSEQLTKYVKEHYENVQVFLVENWLRLDFNNDGYVTSQDIQLSVCELYKFIKNFEYYSKAIEIKSSLYHEAIKYMKRDLQQESNEASLSENDAKVEKLLRDDA
mmetsp:Transcript_32593/g.31825  ORF Transcript_32593/g.31825 Transcript_32593/m.31825 type:complete len:274 (+) Transcript_32593:43-864(+)|eukprot:CAMPEP_0170542964 /NCGR_PEP_ID=MMETSP0211-20121228/2233_1 /TAXON_ID=311385 /ORGANISM="Pseudokeronopsis sp., Strain OXSARD2" /LENGTH=273 /DNA_ID=CAMNT_0010846211 /DNA_START=32 /DNA_END=853 /DNA_ORIENTATION=-